MNNALKQQRERMGAELRRWHAQNVEGWDPIDKILEGDRTGH